VERASFVSLSRLAGSKLTEVLGGLGNNVVVEPEDNALGGIAADADIELVFIGHGIGIVGLGCEKSSRAHSTRYQYVRRRWTFGVRCAVKKREMKRSEKIFGR